MRIARGRAPAPSEQRTETFTGGVWADPVLAAEGEVGVNDVFFEPGARTHWHTHAIGQVLVVTHGAAPDSYLLHVAISLGAATWLEPVSDADYAAGTGRS